MHLHIGLITVLQLVTVKVISYSVNSNPFNWPLTIELSFNGQPSSSTERVNLSPNLTLKGYLLASIISHFQKGSTFPIETVQEHS